MIISISTGSSKLNSIPSISLPPIKTCSTQIMCKSKCYAIKSYIRFPDVRNAWDRNYNLFLDNPKKYFHEIDSYLKLYLPKYFRWHISGDIVNSDYLQEVLTIANNHKKTNFLLYTKKYYLLPTIIKKPSNLEIVLSVWLDQEIPNYNYPLAFTQRKEDKKRKNTIICEKNCTDCKICWHLSKLKKNIIFKLH